MNQARAHLRVLEPAPRPIRDAAADFDALLERALQAGAEDRPRNAWALGDEARHLYLSSRGACLEHFSQAEPAQVSAFEHTLSEAIGASIAGDFARAEGFAQTVKSLWRAAICQVCSARRPLAYAALSGVPLSL